MMWRRRKSVVNFRQQVWFALELVAVTLGFVMLCAFFLFVPPLSYLFEGEESTAWVLDALLRVVFMKWPVVMAALAVWFGIGLLMSHRLSGPLYGLDRTLLSWKKGDRSARVRFRKYDYLLPAKDSLNSFFDRQENLFLEVQAVLESIEKSGAGEANRKSVSDLLAKIKKTENE
ncbi:MAG TPA: hypothetical protein VI895_11525 [Bdellovibrionota bacterium]|nr:hypothetical protein [Bdellovibrionota bacterium]